MVAPRPDPLVDGIDADALAVIFARRRRPIKDVLLDQTVLAGVGNIQATEGLWRAKLDPRSRADRLKPPDIRALARGILWTIERTLRDAEKYGDEIGYVSDAEGDNPFLVYGHKGEACPRCKAPIKNILLGGRTTYFCAKCQRRA